MHDESQRKFKFEFFPQNPSKSLFTQNDEDENGEPSEGSYLSSRSCQDGDKEKETENEEKSTTFTEKLKMVPVVISSVLVSITLELHRLSRNYRYVLQVLAREKKALKVCSSSKYYFKLFDVNLHQQQSPDFAAKLYSLNITRESITGAETSK